MCSPGAVFPCPHVSPEESDQTVISRHARKHGQNVAADTDLL